MRERSRERYEDDSMHEERERVNKEACVSFRQLTSSSG